MDKQLFVVGAPRSGTSYLARALSLADDVAFFEESGMFYPFGSRLFPTFFNDVLRKEPVYHFNLLENRLFRLTDFMRGLDRLEGLVSRMLLHTKLKPYDLSPSEELIRVQKCQLDEKDMALQKELVAKYRRLAKDDGPRDLFHSLFSDFVRLSNKKHLLEKTPNHIAFVPVIRSVFPDAKVILIRRDKRDAIASYLKHFDARTTLRNRVLSDRMLLKKQCKVCCYYERIEEWLIDQPWCSTIEYGQMVELPFETVQDALQRFGLTINESKYGSLFVSRKASSTWNRLSQNEQRLVEAMLRLETV